MKRISIFIGLKVAEISAIVFIPYYLGMLLSKWEWFCVKFTLQSYWITGFMGIWALVASLGAVLLIVLLVIGNWNWAKKIAGR